MTQTYRIGAQDGFAWLYVRETLANYGQPLTIRYATKAADARHYTKREVAALMPHMPAGFRPIADR